MSVESQADLLDWNGERYLPEIAGNIRLEHLHRYLVARELSRGRIVLDIACGEGYGADILAAVAERVIGVDMAPDVIAHAASRYQRPNLTFRGGSCAAIPLGDASVDVVVSFETIEHHDQHEQMLAEVRRVLKPGGLLVISSPDRHEYSEAPRFQNPFHVHELSREEFEALLRSRFANVAIVGQRIRAGSMIGTSGSGTATRFLTFRDGQGELDALAGLEAPMYLLAVASDAELPAVPIGLMDGGPFMWTVSIAPIEDAAAPDEVDITLAGRLVGLERASAGYRTQIKELTAQVERLRRAVERHREQALATWQRSLADQARLEDMKKEAASARLREEDACKATAGAKAEVDGLKRAVADAQAEVARLATAMAEADAARIAALREAESLRRQPLPARLRRFVWRLMAHGSRTLYRAAPLPRAWKMLVKRQIFKLAPARFHSSASYIAWQGQERQADVVEARSAATPLRPELPSPLLGTIDVRRPGGERDYVALAYGARVTSAIKAIAFYLPQFHPIPENDAWWGRGFTEWTNVTRGRAQYDGHYQPHLPGELGFYDLRVPAIQRRQIELAKQYGIHGFCYYYYWFDGVRLLDAPLNQMLATPDLDFPFCLCWANENWTRRWDGADDDVLIAQRHDEDDEEAFIRQIEPALRDPRYIKVDGKALLLVYRPALLPDAAATARRWRKYGRSVGLDLFLVSTHAFDRRDPRDFGFDAALEFAPNNIDVPAASDISGLSPAFQGRVFDYRALVEGSRRYEPASYPYFRSVTPMWDNEARRPGRGTIYAHSTPSRYGEWLSNACRYTEQFLPPEMPFVFINAWNEWSEGAHLEPDRRYGYAYLQATATSLAAFPADRSERPGVIVVSHDAHFNGAQVLALHIVRALAGTFHMNVHVLLCGDGPLKTRFAESATVYDAGPSVSEETVTVTIRQLRARGVTTAFCNTSAVGRVAALLEREGFSVVSMVHELPGIITSMQLEDSVAAIARAADHVVFPAEVVRREFLRLTSLDPARTSVRPQGLPAPNPFRGRRQSEARQALRERLGIIDEHARIVLGAGYADRRKGIDLFVEAGRTLAAELDDVVLVWLGSHEPSAFAAAVETIEPERRHRFLFPLSVPDFEVFFAGSDLFLMTSREDPFPTVVLHALDAELPVVGFNGAGGFVELLERGYGVLVPYLDTAAMARAASQLLASPADRRRLAEAGAEVLGREFAFTSYVRYLLDLTRTPQPRVSVIVPNYNYARYLPERLASIVKQTLPPHEILFLDDGSKDDSVAIAREVLATSGLTYRIIRQQTRQGTYRQWLRGLSEATGDIVWIAEADDACAPTFLEKLTPAFADSAVALVYSQSRQVDQAGVELAPDYLRYTDPISRTKWLTSHVRNGGDEIRDTLFVKNTIPSASAVLMRKPELASIEAVLSQLKFAGDWLVYVTALQSGSVAFVPEALNRHRRHPDSAIARAGLDMMKEMLLVQRHVLAHHPIAPDVIRLRDEEFQKVYEHLGLHLTGPKTFAEHPELGAPHWVGAA